MERTDSEIVALANYRFGRVMGEAADVPAGLVKGIRGKRSEYSFVVKAPDTTNAEAALENDDSTDSIMWCLEFSVECRKRGARSGLDPDDALQMTGLIARDVLTALVLNLPKLGFPGEFPTREKSTVMLDGEPAKLDMSKHRDPNLVTLVTDTVVSLSQIKEAATGSHPPSRARMMAAEAGHQALFNPRASDVTAVVVAASACEVAIHECVRRLASGHVDRLTKKLIPRDGQAKLSPKDIVDTVVPLVVNRQLSDEYPRLWGSIKELFRARDIGVHQGFLPKGTNPIVLVNQARRFVRWIEDLDK